MEAETDIQQGEIDAWVGSESNVDLLIGPRETRRKAAEALVIKKNYSIGKKPGLGRGHEGELALFVDVGKKDEFVGPSNFGYFMSKVHEAMMASVSEEGTLGRIKRLGKGFVERRESMDHRADQVIESLMLLIKEAKLEKIVLVCPEMEQLLPESLERVVADLANRTDDSLQLKGGLNGERSGVTSKARRWSLSVVK